MKATHYEPKKKKWNSLSDLKRHLEQETSEEIVQYDGWQLVTKTTRYTIAHGELFISCPELTQND